MSYIFPKNLMAGFVQRGKEDKLAFITYIDPVKKQICSAKSFDGWRDHDLGLSSWENTPQTGFVINKNVKRDSYFGGAQYIRVWHPSGFEFEISIPVFERLINFVDISKGEVVTPCVLGWSGQKVELISSLDPLFKGTTDNPSYTAMDIAKDMMITSFDIGQQYDFKGSTVMYLGHGTIMNEQDIFYSPRSYRGVDKNPWFYIFDTQEIVQLKTRVKHLRAVVNVVSDESMNDAIAKINNVFVMENMYGSNNFKLPFGVNVNPKKISINDIYFMMNSYTNTDYVEDGDKYIGLYRNKNANRFSSDYEVYIGFDGNAYYTIGYHACEKISPNFEAYTLIKRKKL